jgi:hypothetical protein
MESGEGENAKVWVRLGGLAATFPECLGMLAVVRYLSNEADVLREMKSFFGTLR